MKTTKVVLQTRTIKRTSVIGNLKKHWQLFLFLILPLLYIIIFAYGPMMGLQIAFKDFDAAKGVWGSPWVGLKHFKNFISSYQFARVLKNTLVTSVYSLVARFPVPILLALSINIMRNKRFKKATQMIVYVPHFISVVVLVGMVNQFFNPFVGLYGNIYKMMFGTNAPDLIFTYVCLVGCVAEHGMGLYNLSGSTFVSITRFTRSGSDGWRIKAKTCNKH